MSTSDDPYQERDQRIREKLHVSRLAFIRAMLTHPHLKEATRQVEQHAGQEFDRFYGHEMEALRLEEESLVKQRDRRGDRLREIEHRERDAKTHLKVAK